MAKEPADRRAHHEDRRQDAAARPATESCGPDHDLDRKERDQRLHAEAAEQLGVDCVVADAEGARVDQATEPDDESADEWPPHPMHVGGQLLEQVLAAVHGLGHLPGPDARRKADDCRAEQDHAPERRMMGNREQGLGSDEAGACQHHAQTIGRG